MKHIFVFLFLTFGTPCFAQWYFIDGNLGTSGSTVAFGVHDTNLFESTSGGGISSVGRYYSPERWITADIGIDFTQGPITTFTSLGPYFFAGSEPTNQGVGTLSTNNGSSWKTVIGGPVGTNGTYIFAQYATRIARTRDSGKTWEHLSPPAGNFYAGTGIYVLSATPSNGVWRSMDSGGTWSQIPTPLTLINSITLLGTLTFGANGPIIKSTDSGSHWTETTIPNRSVSFLASYKTNLFAGTDSGVFVSQDSGATWRAVDEGLPSKVQQYGPRITALCVFDTLLIVGVDANDNYGYAAARPVREMVDTTQSGVQLVSAPAKDSIEIYPNPALGTVTITSGNIPMLDVRMLNVLGEQVLNLPDAYSSNISFDLRHFASGTYFIEIMTSNGTVLRKIVRE